MMGRYRQSFVADFEARQRILPIPLRPDLTVLIYGIPHDLTQQEAKRIAGIVHAHVLPCPPTEEG